MNLERHSDGELNPSAAPLQRQNTQKNLISTDKVALSVKFDKKAFERHPMDFSTEHMSDQKSDTLLNQ